MEYFKNNYIIAEVDTSSDNKISRSQEDYQINELAKIIDKRRVEAGGVIGSMNNFGMWYAEAIYSAGYRKISEPKKENMFHWKNGYLPKDEWLKLSSAMNAIGSLMFTPNLAGFVDDDGTNYYAVDLVSDPEDVKKAFKVIAEYLNINLTGII